MQEVTVCSQALNYQPNTAGNFKALRLSSCKTLCNTPEAFHCSITNVQSWWHFDPMRNSTKLCRENIQEIKLVWRLKLDRVFGEMIILWSLSNMDTFWDTTLFRTVRVRSGVAPPTHTHTYNLMLAHADTMCVCSERFGLDRESPQGFASIRYFQYKILHKICTISKTLWSRGKLVISSQLCISKLWIFNEARGISRISPDPLLSGGVWARD